MVMIIKGIAVVLSGLVGLGIIAIGVRFLLLPRAAAAGYGVAINEEIGGARAYLSAKGVRDIVSGLVVFLLIAIAGHRVLGWWMLVMTLIPIGDAVVVLRRVVPRPPPTECTWRRRCSWR
jgi:Domain of unknown function (DUF4267)